MKKHSYKKRAYYLITDAWEESMIYKFTTKMRCGGYLFETYPDYTGTFVINQDVLKTGVSIKELNKTQMLAWLL